MESSNSLRPCLVKKYFGNDKDQRRHIQLHQYRSNQKDGNSWTKSAGILMRDLMKGRSYVWPKYIMVGSSVNKCKWVSLGHSLTMPAISDDKLLIFYPSPQRRSRLPAVWHPLLLVHPLFNPWIVSSLENAVQWTLHGIRIEYEMMLVRFLLSMVMGGSGQKTFTSVAATIADEVIGCWC